MSEILLPPFVLPLNECGRYGGSITGTLKLFGFFFVFEEKESKFKRQRASQSWKYESLYLLLSSLAARRCK